MRLVLVCSLAGGLVDDAGVLSKASQGQVLKAIKGIEEKTGYKLEVVTVRKLVFESDPFAFADQVRGRSDQCAG